MRSLGDIRSKYNELTDRATAVFSLNRTGDETNRRSISLDLHESLGFVFRTLSEVAGVVKVIERHGEEDYSLTRSIVSDQLDGIEKIVANLEEKARELIA